MKGLHHHQMAYYLDEFMWSELHGKTASQAFENIMGVISQQYPV